MSASKVYITRLYRYRNALLRFKNLGFVKIFSDNLAEAIGSSPSQVRKDFSMFGLIGKKRGGYVIEELLCRLNEILSKNDTTEVVVVGVGNVGRALINYPGFAIEGIRIIAGFDIDPVKHKAEAVVPVYSLDKLKEFISQRRVGIAILAVPDIAAQQVLDMLIAAGIKGVLNFAPIQLKSPESVVINDVNLGIELETVIYFVNALQR